MTIRERIKHAWDVFKTPNQGNFDYGSGSSRNPSRTRTFYGTEKSIVTSVFNKMAVDVAGIAIRHVRVDENGKFVNLIDSSLNECLTIEANIDQSGRQLIQDVAMTLFNVGVAAIVPIETTVDPTKSASYEIKSLRVGQIREWYPEHVRIDLWNEKIGRREEVILPKKTVAVVENPFYAVMNDSSSVAKRLIHKLNLLDSIDEQSGSGKLDIIIQLPYVIKNKLRMQQAEDRRKAIEEQLVNSKYGIAYTDGTERITQLNRPAENNLMQQVEYLTSMLYSQLGTTENVFNGTADEKEMLNYFNNTIDPILSAIVDAIKRSFLTKTARSQKQDVLYFREPFKLVPVNNLADIVDKFTRNEILSSNEVRGIIGYRPVDDPKADELRNKNISQAADDVAVSTRKEGEKEDEV